MTISEATKLPSAAQTATRSFVWLAAIATGVIVTNLFAPQILVGVIGPSLGMSAWQAGMISTLTLLGYALGLFLLVPLADLFENRRLILRTLSCAILAALGTAIAPTPLLLLVATFVLGASCAAIQMLVPLVASMTPPEHRGRVIGDVMSGLMTGILLSRPLASLIADTWSWRAFYLVSAVSMAALTGALALYLPTLRPVTRVGYGMLLASFPKLLKDEPVLRVRAWTAALVMASFTAYWAAIALRLSSAPFNLNAKEIAMFALMGAAGTAATPLAGRLGDRRWARPMLFASHLLIIISLGALRVGRLDRIPGDCTVFAVHRHNPIRRGRHQRSNPWSARDQSVAARSTRPFERLVCGSVLHRRSRWRRGCGFCLDFRRMDRGLRRRRVLWPCCADHRQNDIDGDILMDLTAYCSVGATSARLFPPPLRSRTRPAAGNRRSGLPSPAFRRRRKYRASGGT
jgi:predicted MFS family arabinose efflux permease